MYKYDGIVVERDILVTFESKYEEFVGDTIPCFLNEKSKNLYGTYDVKIVKEYNNIK